MPVEITDVSDQHDGHARRPLRLQPGDTIGVVTPSSPVSWSPSPEPMRELERGSRLLEELGFHVVLGDYALKDEGLGAGTAQERAEDINRMFGNPEVRAIITSHGGWVSNAVLPYLDWQLIRGNPKIFMGFSDITVLLLAIHAQTGLVTFHGNTVIWHFGLQPEDYDVDEFLNRLVRGDTGAVRKNSQWKAIRGSGSAEGRLLGGHLTQIQMLLGTPYLPDFSDSILFVEMVGYEAAVTHPILHQLKQNGLFEGVRGVVVGNVLATDEDTGPPLEELLLQITREYAFPILKCHDFGHGVANTVLPVGTWARIDADAAELLLLEPCVM